MFNELCFKEFFENLGSVYPHPDFEPEDSDWGQAERYFNSIKLNYNWLPSYHNEIIAEIKNGIQRIREAMKSKGCKIRQCPFHGSVRLLRIPSERIIQRGDTRYSSEELAKIIEDGNDLVPVTIGELDGKFYLQDGHHRLRAYKMLNQPVLCLVVGLVRTQDPSMFGKIVFE